MARALPISYESRYTAIGTRKSRKIKHAPDIAKRAPHAPARVGRFAAAAAVLLAAVAVFSIFRHRSPIGASSQPAIAGLQNVLLVTIDTLRADHVSGYGYARRLTPNIDGLIQRGARFQYAFSTSSITVPSHVSILTGLYPSWTSTGLENGQQFALDESVTTLAELCRDAGIYTAAVVSSETLMHKVGLNQGFADFDDRIVERHPTRPTRKQPADAACGKMLQLLKRNAGKPFFAWLHLMDPHGPYTPPREWLGRVTALPASSAPTRTLAVGADESGYQSIPRYQRYDNETAFANFLNRYDAEIAFADHHLGRLVDELDRLGMLKNTLVIVTADHGEALGEDDFYFSHTHSVGLDQVHVPLVFAGPGIAAGQAFTAPVSNNAVFATACAALGLTPPKGHSSANLLDCLTGKSPPPQVPAFAGAMSQWGAAKEDVYYRKDRRPESDAAFWAKNYNSNAPHKPCGEQLIQLSDGKALSPAGRPDIKALVDGFGRAADVAFQNVPRVRKVNRDWREKARLKQLGYMSGDDAPPASSRP